MRKCRNGWHFDDGRGYGGICSECILKIPHPTIRRLERKAIDLLSGIYRGRKEHLSNLPSKALEVSMRQARLRMQADYLQAYGLLRDNNLVWSKDFDSIRYDLARLIKEHAEAERFPGALTDVVQTLIAEENDLSV